MRALQRRDDYGAEGSNPAFAIIVIVIRDSREMSSAKVLPEVFAKGQGERTRAQRTLLRQQQR